jgi:hypothetical protein
MAHNHGYEYQIRIVREDGIEELSGWMNSTEKVTQTIMAAYRPQGKSYWLMVRNIICSNCSEREQIIEHPIVDIPSPRFTPHDSRYLQAGDTRDRCSLGFTAPRHTP